MVVGGLKTKSGAEPRPSMGPGEGSAAESGAGTEGRSERGGTAIDRGGRLQWTSWSISAIHAEWKRLRHYVFEDY